tara:strand:- start:3901 stop:4743 length:843 start_codon:yes stop_codon:yes gene_type:complete
MIEVQSIQSCWVNGEVNGNFITPFTDLNVEVPFKFTKEKRPVVVLGDRELPLVHRYKTDQKVVGWLGGEPRVVVPEAYEFVKNNIDDFEMVFTFDEDLLNSHPKFRFCPFGSSRFSNKEDRTIRSKDKNLSIIGNVRYCNYPGHILRDAIINKWGSEFDSIKNRGTFEDKKKYLNDFRYSVVVENSKQNHYFSEKLIDCLLVGTVPIYWGCDTLFDFGFDKRGIITFENEDDLEEILSSIGELDYEKRMPWVSHNHSIAQSYLQCFYNKFLWENGLKELL